MHARYTCRTWGHIGKHGGIGIGAGFGDSARERDNPRGFEKLLIVVILQLMVASTQSFPRNGRTAVSGDRHDAELTLHYEAPRDFLVDQI